MVLTAACRTAVLQIEAAAVGAVHHEIPTRLPQQKTALLPTQPDRPHNGHGLVNQLSQTDIFGVKCSLEQCILVFVTAVDIDLVDMSIRCDRLGHRFLKPVLRDNTNGTFDQCFSQSGYTFHRRRLSCGKRSLQYLQKVKRFVALRFLHKCFAEYVPL